MKLLNTPLTRRVRLYQSTLVAILFASVVAQSQANAYTLSARDTSLQVNLAGGLGPWTIDGANQLNRQWFYYSVGSGPVYSIDTIPLISSSLVPAGNNPFATAVYSNSIIKVTTTYTLQSQPNGSGRATLQDAISFQNTSASSQDFHFYQFSDFDLAGSSGSQNLQFFGGNNNLFVQTGWGGTSLSNTISATWNGQLAVTRVQAGISDGSQFGLINGNPYPTLDNTTLTASGNVSFAYEWDVNLAAAGSPGSSLSLSEIQAVVPEPSSLALVASGMFAAAWFGRRRPGGQCKSRSS
jgi:large repetitive protein